MYAEKANFQETQSATQTARLPDLTRPIFKKSISKMLMAQLLKSMFAQDALRVAK